MRHVLSMNPSIRPDSLLCGSGSCSDQNGWACVTSLFAVSQKNDAIQSYQYTKTYPHNLSPALDQGKHIVQSFIFGRPLEQTVQAFKGRSADNDSVLRMLRRTRYTSCKMKLKSFIYNVGVEQRRGLSITTPPGIIPQLSMLCIYSHVFSLESENNAPKNLFCIVRKSIFHAMQRMSGGSHLSGSTAPLPMPTGWSTDSVLSLVSGSISGAHIRACLSTSKT